MQPSETETANDRLAAIQQRTDAATPGPWLWNGDVDNHSMRLSAVHSGRYTVMDLARWGMGSAKARFQIKSRGMVPANEMVQYEVCADATERSDPRVYRGDYKAIRHPDAEFIAHSRTDVDWLLAEVVLLRGQLAAAVELAEQLNVTCRYHGHHIERTVFGRPEPCCDTGREAVRNVRLIAALGGAR